MENNNETKKWFTRGGSEVTKNVVPVKEDTAEWTHQEPCSRCGGAGGHEMWRFTGWTCFDCGGSGKGNIRTEKVYTAEKLAKLNESQSKRDAKKAEKLAAEWEVKTAAQKIWREAHAEALALMESVKEGNPFLMDLVYTAEIRPLSDRQLETGVEAANRQIERQKKNAETTWVASEGERIEFVWTTDKVVELEPSFFGYRKIYNSLVLAHDENGNNFKYIGSGYGWPPVGETRKVKATVKSHDEYKGVKQTVVSRPKFTEQEVSNEGEN